MPKPSRTSLKNLDCTYPDCYSHFRLPVKCYRVYRTHPSGPGWLTCTCPACRRPISLKADIVSINVLLSQLPSLRVIVCSQDSEFAEHFQHPLADIPILKHEIDEFNDAVNTALDDYARELRDAYPNLRLT